VALPAASEQVLAGLCGVLDRTDPSVSILLTGPAPALEQILARGQSIETACSTSTSSAR
jgi:hypothetical protein